MFIFLILRLQNLVCFYIYAINWFEPATSQVLNSHMCLVTTILDIAVIDEYFSTGFW